MISVGHPDGRQFSGPMKTTISRSPAFVGISDGATTPHQWPRLCELAMNSHTVRPHNKTPAAKTAAQLADRARFIGNFAKIFYRPRSLALSVTATEIRSL
jgi:hypothetical protein